MRSQIDVRLDLEGEPGRVTVRLGNERIVSLVATGSVEWTSLVVAIHRVLLRQRAIERMVVGQESNPQTSEGQRFRVF